MIGYNITKSEDNGVAVTVFINGSLFTVTEHTHTKFQELLTSLSELSKATVAKTAETIQFYTEVITQYVTDKSFFITLIQSKPELNWVGGHIYYGETPLFGTLVEKIIEFNKEGIPAEYLWMFLDRLMKNPNDHSREQLFEFLDRYSFPITPAGRFLAYKAVRSDFTSVHRGYGEVDGVVYRNDHLPQKVGSVVTMPREKVDSDPSSACSFGLHVGSLEYVKGFKPSNGHIFIVAVDPADVVSVPTDSSFMKVRACKYENVGIFGEELTEKVYSYTPDGVTPLVVEEEPDEDTLEIDDAKGVLVAGVLRDHTIIDNVWHLSGALSNVEFGRAKWYANDDGHKVNLRLARSIYDFLDTDYGDSIDIRDLKIDDSLVPEPEEGETVSADNVYHLAGKIANKMYGKGKWRTKTPKYEVALKQAFDIYGNLDHYCTVVTTI